jgi:hypothetical protein
VSAIDEAIATDLERFLERIWQPDDVREVRSPKHDGYSTASGYFDDPAKLVEGVAGARLDGRANVYVTINPVEPALLARAANRIDLKAKTTTADKDVVRRRWLFIDIDPARPAGIMATDDERARAQAVANAIATYLRDLGWPDPVVAMSGNGYALFYPIDLPNDEASKRLVEGVLAHLAGRFDTDGAKVDTSVANAARIVGLIGTMKRKGDSTADRPHRRSELLRTPIRADAVTADQLAALVPEPKEGPRADPFIRVGDSLPPGWVKAWLDSAGVDYREHVRDGVTWYRLEHCPFHPDDDIGGDCGVAELPNGAAVGKCLHNRGKGMKWADFRRELGLGPTPEAQTNAGGQHADGATSGDGTTPTAKPGGRPSVAKALMAMIAARGARPFRDQRRQVYIADGPATIERSVWGSWLGRLWWDSAGSPLNDDARKWVVETLEAQALFGDGVDDVYLRVAPIPDGIAIDMGGDDWNAITITATGWVIAAAPVRFRRSPSMGVLPIPSRDGSLVGLGGLLNLDAEQAALVTGFLLGSLHPSGPYPVLGLSGVQGSAKSMTSRLVRRIVDPVAPTAGNGLKSITKDEASFWTTATNSWLAAFDNVSGLTPEISDRLCQLATGAGRSARKLYTDGDMYEQSACRPVILNGMELADRPDLLSRTIPVELQRLEVRATEESLLEEFDRMHPVLLGGLLDAVVGLLGRIGSLPHRQKDGARMFDHVRWVTAAEPALGWDDGFYAELFSAVQEALLAQSTDGIVWLKPLEALLESGEWHGTASDLLDQLKSLARLGLSERERPDPFGWPKTGKGMADALTRYGEALRSVGIRHRTLEDRKRKTHEHWLDRGGDAGVGGGRFSMYSPTDPQEEEEKERGGTYGGNPRHSRQRPQPAAERGETGSPQWSADRPAASSTSTLWVDDHDADLYRAHQIAIRVVDGRTVCDICDAASAAS